MSDTMIKLTIDGEPLEVPAGTTVMKAAEKLGINIPRLCYHPDLSLEGACRVCVVQVEGFSHFITSCSQQVWEGMTVQTNSPQIRQARRDILELLLDNHPKDCQTCERDGNCELQRQAYRLGVRERLFEGKRKQYPVDESGRSVVRNPEKCILCGRCIRVCAEVQGVHEPQPARPRLQHRGGPRQPGPHGRERLHPVRPVRGRLPHRGLPGEGPHRAGVGGPQRRRRQEARRGPHGSCHPGHHRRVLRVPARARQ